MTKVRNPKPLKMCGCDDEILIKVKCPGCEHEFKVSEDKTEVDCPNCGQDWTIEELKQ